MNKLDKESIVGISALLVHAANIDENYSEHEKNLVKNFIKSYIKDDDADQILKKAEEIENNSNQLLNYTNIIKKNSIDTKKDIIRRFITFIDLAYKEKVKIKFFMDFDLDYLYSGNELASIWQRCKSRINEFLSYKNRK